MKFLNAAQILHGFLWNKENELPKNVFKVSMEKGFEIDQTVLLPYLIKFQRWIKNNQPETFKEPPTKEEIIRCLYNCAKISQDDEGVHMERTFEKEAEAILKLFDK